MNRLAKNALRISTGAVMFLAVCGPVAAQTMRTEGSPPMDPVVSWADELLPRNEFVLNSQDDVELVRYKTPRDIEICVARPHPSQIDGTRRAVPVRVSWDNDVGTIRPGNCLSFDARSVKIRPAATLPDNAELTGTFRVIHH